MDEKYRKNQRFTTKQDSVCEFIHQYNWTTIIDVFMLKKIKAKSGTMFTRLTLRIVANPIDLSTVIESIHKSSIDQM